MRTDDDAGRRPDDYLDFIPCSSIVSQNQIILLYFSFLIVIMSQVRKHIVSLTGILEGEVWILGIPFLLKWLVGTWHAKGPFARQEELMAVDQASPLLPGAWEMLAPKVVVTALKMCVDFWVTSFQFGTNRYLFF